MRPAIVCLAALALAACGPARNAGRDPALQVRSPGQVRVYVNREPRCGYREVGSVIGRSYGELRTAAFRLGANAVIVMPERYRRVGMEGTAVRFVFPRCQY